jgi:lipopolysaccharide/colanic/teichoic acid biosynthesis glycosyltransferase
VKRVFDLVASSIGLAVLTPVLIAVALLVWLQDRGSPFYLGVRTGRQGRPFRLVKFRSMILDADRTGVDSTGRTDPRITALGTLLRKAKLDEIPGLWNVFRGDMSLVGPRPNVPRETALYTAAEQHLLDVRPGVTDLASIVFADEGDILAGAADPDLRYNQVIRPWKSRLGLLYVRRHGSVWLDLRIILLTLRNSIDRAGTLERVARLAERLGADPAIAAVARRRIPLTAAPPPGATAVVANRRAPPP